MEFATAEAQCLEMKLERGVYRQCQEMRLEI